jgi:plasmid segregation protein ParM
MKDYNNTKIIGIDHGYGNMKTANFCFKTGIAAYDSEPLFTKDMLVYDGRYYLIGEGHKEFVPDKIKDEDYYILTLVAIAKELKAENLTEANVIIAAGLPLSWVSGQKKGFAAYLAKNKEVNFNYKKVDYHITIEEVRIYPQGFSAIAETAASFKGVNLLCDIGNGTMNLLYIRNGRPDSLGMYTEKFGTEQCVNAIKNAVMDKFQVVIDSGIIEEYIRTGKADIAKEYLKVLKTTATDYVSDIFRRLNDHEYNSGLMKLYVVGGGGCLIQNFGNYDKSRVIINEDISATAKGYEYLSERYLKKDGEKL